MTHPQLYSKHQHLKTLPNDIEVTLCVENVFKREEDDSCFRLECRVCDGTHTGEMINIHFYRNKKDGTAPRKDTTWLLETCFKGEEAKDVPSWKMRGIIFKTTPWHPETSKYQMFTRFKYVGRNELFSPETDTNEPF
jgi:hypothetical protein